VFRVAAFALFAPPHDAAGMRGVWIQLAFRVLLGGFWGSILQAFRAVRPRSITAVVVCLALVGHLLEFLALTLGGSAHIKAGMAVSVIISAGSLIVNWGLLRRGLLLTGQGSETLSSDFRKLPRALLSMFRGRAQ